jgi:lysophospholipase L1-like esterase
MSRRLFILVSLFLTAGFCVYLYRLPAGRPSVQPDAFDEPFVSDPALVKEFAEQPLEFPFKAGDRVAWIGSSSTYIGEWRKTMEFLLRSRHPELKLTFSTHSTGGGTFLLAVSKLPGWLERSRPTLVFFNYGANDAAYGEARLGEFQTSMKRSVELAQEAKARVLLITHQSGDARVTGTRGYFRRKHYADEMLKFCKANGWPIVDVHHPLEELQTKAQAVEPAFTINFDTIHLTDSGYVAWAFFLYDRLHPPDAESLLDIDARSSSIFASKNCTARLLAKEEGLAFERIDDVLPILPPNPLPPSTENRSTISASHALAQSLDYIQQKGQNLPPREFVPLEARSKYMLKVTGLSNGAYALRCNGKPCGSATAAQLETGVNLNSLVLDAGVEAPWSALAKQIWDGKTMAELIDRKLVFRIKPL